MFDELDSPEADDDNAERFAAFEARVNKQIKILKARKAGAERRVKAAQWLGESGAPQAIEPLVEVYRKEPKNTPLRRAVVYALGQFKALDDMIERDAGESIEVALEREDNSFVSDMLVNIALNGVSPRRRAVSRRALLVLTLVLLLTLVGLVAANVSLLNEEGPPPDPLANIAPPTHATGLEPETISALNALGQVRDRLTGVNADAGLLRGEFITAQGGGTLNCNLNFFNPRPYDTPSIVADTQPHVAIIVNRVNAQIDRLDGARLVRAEACNGGVAMTAAQASTQLDTLATIDGELLSILEAVTTAEDNLNVAVPPTATPTIPPEDIVTDTPEPPTITPTPTIAPEVINNHLRQLTSIISTVNEQRGANTLLIQYIDDINRAGVTDGCRLPPPAIPDDYQVTSAYLLDEEPLLSNAQMQVNLGLALLRDAWADFGAGCNAGELVAALGIMRARSQAAQSALEDAAANISALQIEMRQR